MAHLRGIYSRQNAEGKTRWYVRVALQGRMQHFGSFPTQRAAQEFYEKVRYLRREQRSTPGFIQPTEYTIPELFDAYLPILKGKADYDNQVRYAEWWKARWPHGHVLKLTSHDIELARADLRTSGRFKRRSEATVILYLKSLKTAMRKVIQPRTWVLELWREISMPRQKGLPPRHMTLEDEELVHQQLSDDDREKVRLSTISGLRRGQLFRVNWEDLYWTERAVSLPVFKRQQPRLLPLSAEALALFRKRWLRAGSPASGPVFPSKDDPTVAEDPKSWYKYRFKKAVDKAGLAGKGIKFHSTRHTFAIRFLEGGGNIRALQRAGGWSSLRQVEPYLDIFDDQVRQGMEGVSQIGQFTAENCRNEKHRTTKKQRNILKYKAKRP